MMNYAYIGLFLFGVFLASLSQIILKKSAMKEHPSGLHEYLNPGVITAYGIFFISMLIAITAYRHLPLKVGVIVESVGYVFVSVLSFFILKEKLSARNMVGSLLIVAGFIIFNI